MERRCGVVNLRLFHRADGSIGLVDENDMFVVRFYQRDRHLCGTIPFVTTVRRSECAMKRRQT